MAINDRIPPSIFFITLATLVSGVAACNLVDDDTPEQPIEEADTEGGAAECLEAAEQIQSACLPPQQFIAIWDEGNSSMILADDPAASIGIGPEGWLVQVSGSADYVGSYHFDGDTCTIGCGWCLPGQDMCYGGFDDNGLPRCMMCFSADAPDAEAQCTQHLEACLDPNGGGLDETGTGADAGSEGGVDETGGDTGDTGDTEGLLEYDCAHWNPAGTVTLDERGNAIIDATIVEEIVVHYGDPLAECDGTSFRQQSNGYFAIGSMTSTGVLAQMGLVPGDVILAIDGVPMTDIETIADTTVALFLGHRITSGFTLTVGRGRERIARSVFVR